MRAIIRYKVTQTKAEYCDLIVLIENLLEYIALFDFITDVVVTVQLFESANSGWAVATVIAMVAPLLVSSIQTIQFLLDRVIRRDKKSTNIVLMATAWTSICPIFTVYMLLMDQVFVVNTTLLTPVAFLFKKCFKIQCLNKMIDSSYERLFQMKPHEVGGFRRMRTIT